MLKRSVTTVDGNKNEGTCTEAAWIIWIASDAWKQMVFPSFGDKTRTCSTHRAQHNTTRFSESGFQVYREEVSVVPHQLRPEGVC